MILSALQSQIAVLCNDPNNARYLIADINQELDNAQNQWNAEIKIIKETTTIPMVSGQRQYLLSLITGTPISFPRATQAGIDLKKRSKSYFDLYTSYDWTQIIGTPTDFFIEATDPSNLYLTVYPIPQSGDAANNLVVEAVIAHTPMVNATDVPFMSGALSNYLLRPYDFYLCFDVAARLLTRDPSAENSSRMSSYLTIATQGKDALIDVFKQLEASEPLRISGGRYFS